MDFNSDGNLAERWKRWKQTANLYLEVSMGTKAEKDRCRAFLYIIGQEGREIYNTFTLGDDEKDKLDVLMQKFETNTAFISTIQMEQNYTKNWICIFILFLNMHPYQMKNLKKSEKEMKRNYANIYLKDEGWMA